MASTFLPPKKKTHLLPSLTVEIRIRLYTTKTLKPLGTLDYHKDACHAVLFARRLDYESDDEEEEGEAVEEHRERCRWLFAGGKEGRVSVWCLMEF
jgi:ASTRA-associated protein 1